jgi:hypothetical protein
MSERMLSAINEIEHRLDNAKRAFHNTRDWYDEGEEYTPTGQTYTEWVFDAFEDAKRIAKSES